MENDIDISDLKLPVITISREYSSGGRPVAESLAQELGVPLFDRNFLRKAAIDKGVPERDFEKSEEVMSNLDLIVENIINDSNSSTCNDRIFEMQKQIILELAKKPCVILGRCSNIILRENNIKSFDVYLFASKKNRIKRAFDLNENGTMELSKFIDKMDSQRENYYKYYTGKVLGDYHDYNMCIDTGYLGFDKTVDVIISALRA